MIKDCNVILNNSAATVVQFDDIKIQFPPIHYKAETLRILYKDGKYNIVNPDYEEVSQQANNKRKQKKTTVENAENLEESEENSVDEE